MRLGKSRSARTSFAVSGRSTRPSRIAGVVPRLRSENDFTQFRHTTKIAMRSMALARRFENAIVSRL
jgi:hypothetical protein